MGQEFARACSEMETIDDVVEGRMRAALHREEVREVTDHILRRGLTLYVRRRTSQASALIRAFEFDGDRSDDLKRQLVAVWSEAGDEGLIELWKMSFWQ